MNNFAALRAKTYGYLTYNNHEDKNWKDNKRVSHKEKLNLKIIKIV